MPSYGAGVQGAARPSGARLAIQNQRRLLVMVEVIGVVSLGACERGGSRLVVTGTLYDTAGVEFIRYGDLRSFQGKPQEIEVDPVISIVSGAEHFVRLSDVAVDEAGAIYVLDSGAHSISVFDDKGSLLRSFGGEGDGPAEFRSVSQLLLVRGQVVLPDLGGRRLVSFDREGEALGTAPLPQGRGLAIRWAFDESGTVFVQHRSLDVPVMRDFGGPGDGRDVLTRVDLEAGSLTPFLALPTSEVVDAMHRPSPMIHVFAAEPAWDLSRDGRLVFGLNSELRFMVLDTTGTPSLIVAADVPPEAVSESGKRIALDLMRESMVRVGAPEERLADLESVVRVADAYPAFTNLVFGPSGTILLQRSTRLSEGQESFDPFWTGGFDVKGFGSGTWDVFSGAGEYLGFVTFPPRFDPKTYLGSVLYGIHYDEYDVQSVRGYLLGQ